MQEHEEPISRERRQEILHALGGVVCEACGGAKSAKMSHCRADYFRLPPKMRRALYLTFGAGYEEAYEDSLRYLKEHYYANPA